MDILYRSAIPFLLGIVAKGKPHSVCFHLPYS